MSFYLKKYMWLISLVAVILCSFFLSKITVNGIRYFFEGGVQVPIVDQAPIEVSTLGKDSKDISAFESVLDRNIFNSKAVRKKPGSDDDIVNRPKQSGDIVEVDPTGEAVKTKLSIKLISTFSVGSGEDGRSSAIISSGSGRRGGGADVYRVNDAKNEFAPDTRIVRILFNKVEFINKGRLEYVELEEFANAVDFNVPPTRDAKKERKKPKKSRSTTEDVEKVSENKYVIARSEIEGAIENLDQLYTQIRAVPHFKGGKPSGFKLYSVNKSSIFGKLGLKKGDILEKINGLELDIKKGLQIFNQLKSESNINIDLTRRGKEMTLEYEIR